MTLTLTQVYGPPTHTCSNCKQAVPQATVGWSWAAYISGTVLCRCPHCGDQFWQQGYHEPHPFWTRLDKLSFVKRKLLALALPSVGQSSCGRCGLEWIYVKSHTTDFCSCKEPQHGHCRGAFALCEGCWQELTVDERMPYYQKLIHIWNRDETNSLRNARLIEAVFQGR